MGSERGYKNTLKSQANIPEDKFGSFTDSGNGEPMRGKSEVMRRVRENCKKFPKCQRC